MLSRGKKGNKIIQIMDTSQKIASLIMAQQIAGKTGSVKQQRHKMINNVNYIFFILSEREREGDRSPSL